MPRKPKSNKLEQESVGWLMTELCIQTTFSIMLYNFYVLTDTFFVARGVGSRASGAIGIFAPFLAMVNGISSTLGVGGGSVIARRMGEGNQEDGKRVVGCILWIWLICSFGITVAGLVRLRPLLFLLGCTEDIYPYAREYGRIMLVGTVASTGFSGIMRAEGDSTYSTFQWCFPVLVNLALDPLFIYRFHWGIAGAAAATLAAQICSMLSSMYYFFFRPQTRCRISVEEIRFYGDICKEVFSVGIPVFLNSLGSSFAGIAGNQIIGAVGGTSAISIYAVVSRIHGFAATPFSGVMQGIQPMLGFDHGRKRRDRMDRTIRYAVRFGVVYGSLIAIFIFIGAEPILNIFMPSGDISEDAVSALRIICWGLIAGGILPVVQALYQALGQGSLVLKLSLCSIFFIRIPLLLLAGVLYSLSGLWHILMLTEWFLAIGACCVYKYKEGIYLWKV